MKNAIYQKINQLLTDLLTKIPQAANIGNTDSLIKTASLKAAAVSGVLSLPAGMLAAATLLPDLVAVWKIQAQLVADIAAANGKHHLLTRETLLYCLFGSDQSASEDLVVRIGQRFVVRKSSQKVFDTLLGKIGMRIGRSLLGDRIARWIPLVGAALVARYSFNDTTRVGATAAELYSHTVEIK